MTIVAKFRGQCAACDAPIHRGDDIEWTRGSKRTYHAKCARALDKGIDPNFSPLRGYSYSSAAMAEDEATFERMAGDAFMAGLR